VIQPLNYSRQVRKQINHDGNYTTDDRRSGLLLAQDHDIKYAASTISDELEQAVKFLMPEGGMILGDRGLRAISGESVRLPFEKMAIEWGAYGKSFVMLAREAAGTDSETGEDCIDVECICFARGSSASPWIAHWEFFPFDTDNREHFVRRDNEWFWVLFDLLNAMACSNVRAERLPARKPAKRAKGALPFDSYHYLTVDVPGKPSGQGAGIGDRRAPREHIRRGHIRRLADGRAIWINATMVNAGIGSRVDKGYIMRADG